jgi:hypothetical protein
MKSQLEHITEKLTHALAFVREANETAQPELRKQHLDEVERLVEYARDTLKGMNGTDALLRQCDCGKMVKVTKPTPESIAWDCSYCGGKFMESDV